MKETFLKTVNTILEYNGACDGVLCADCPFMSKHTETGLSCEEAGVCTPGSYAYGPDPVLVESCEKWKKENGYE